jgi:hypothetical protein
MRRLVKISVLTLVLIGALCVCLLSASVYTFHTLTDETLIAELRFTRTGEDRYTARLLTGDGCDERVFSIYGDQWRLDAQFLKWKYWALLLGLTSRYRLDRIEGRYRDVGEQNAQPTMAYDLKPDTSLDVISVADALGPMNFLIDAQYGTSTYQQIDPARAFFVYRTTTGIITRSEALAAQRGAVPPDGLPIDVRSGCARRPGVWERTVRWVDSRVNAALDSV